MTHEWHFGQAATSPAAIGAGAVEESIKKQIFRLARNDSLQGFQQSSSLTKPTLLKSVARIAVGYGTAIETDYYSVKVKPMDVIARSETTKQSPGFGRFEIAASAFGLLAMTTPQISLDGVLLRVPYQPYMKEIVMKRYRLLIPVLCVGLVGFCALLTYAGEQKKTSEFRNQFVKDFDRISINTTIGDAMMLRILVESARAKRGVEVGSATGFGSINMGIAFERTGGHLYTLEIDPKMVNACRENLQKVGLEDTVTCIEGDALKTLPTLEGQFDFVFLDALKQDYLKYLKLMEPKLKPGSVIVADNVIRSERAMKDFLDYIQTSPDYDTVIIRASMEKNDGISVSYKIK
jgi:predicted O-methyltransferase YrrM